MEVAEEGGVGASRTIVWRRSLEVMTPIAGPRAPCPFQLAPGLGFSNTARQGACVTKFPLLNWLR